MNFKGIDTAQVPAYDLVIHRLEAKRPNHAPVKAAREFDWEFYQIAVQGKRANRVPLNLSGDFLRDLEDDPHDNPKYTAELIHRLDKVIEEAIPAEE